MERTINPTGEGKDADISPAVETPIQDFLIAHRQRVREWLSQTPFASLVSALRNGTRQDQLLCMLQVECWLLRHRQAVLCCRYTRKRFLAEMQSLSGLFGLKVCSSLMREYQSKTPRKVLMQYFLLISLFIYEYRAKGTKIWREKEVTIQRFPM